MYGIGVVFFFFSVSGDKQPWADGPEAHKREEVPYNNQGGEETKPLLEDKDNEPTDADSRPPESAQSGTGESPNDQGDQRNK